MVFKLPDTHPPVEHLPVIRQVTAGTSQVAIGDSIAEGLMEVDGSIAGSTRVSAGPQEVLEKLRVLAESGALDGRSVVFSSGLTNAWYSKNPTNLSGLRDALKDDGVIEQQLELLEQLRARGVKVTVLGVSQENNALNQFNDRLARLAERHGFKVLALTSTAGDTLNIHPDSKELLKSVRAEHENPSPTQVRLELPREQIVQSGDFVSADKALELQQLLRKADPTNTHYNLGTFGKNHDGLDSIAGNMTLAAKDLYVKEHVSALGGNASIDEVIASLRKTTGGQEAIPSRQGLETFVYNFDFTKPQPLQTPGQTAPKGTKKTQTTLT